MEKIKRILTKQQKIQRTNKPFITYTRNQMWKGEPCDFCGSKEGIHKVEGRYVAGSSEDGTLIYLCGLCVKKLEKLFEVDYE